MLRVTFVPHPQTTTSPLHQEKEDVPVNERQQWLLEQQRQGIQCGPADIEIMPPKSTQKSLMSKENIYEILRRVRYHHRNHLYPLNNLKVTKEQFNSYYKFAIVRNPWARAYSWYKNVMRDEIHKKNHNISGEMAFKDFLIAYAGKGMLRPQTNWRKGFDGSIKLDYVGRFESLNESFQKVCASLGVERTELPHKLKGGGGNYRERYDNESIDIISKIYKEEIELFSYAF